MTDKKKVESTDQTAGTSPDEPTEDGTIEKKSDTSALRGATFAQTDPPVQE